jgi:hypothetical protein
MKTSARIFAFGVFALGTVALTSAFSATHAQTMQVISGSEPACQSADPAPLTRLILHGVGFKANSDQLDASAKPVLDYAAAVVRKQPDALIYIAGQPAALRDAGGADIAQRRAQAVASYLQRAGVAATRIAVLEPATTGANLDLFAAGHGVNPVIELKLTSSAEGCNG